jgi:hypothetical protein
MVGHWSIRRKIKMTAFIIFNLLLLTFLFSSAFAYIQPPFGGKRLSSDLFISIALFAIEIVLLFLLYKRLKKQKLFFANIILLTIIMISLFFLAFNSIRLPKGAEIVLEGYLSENGLNDYSVVYVWRGLDDVLAIYPSVWNTPYCIVIEPALSDDRNAFIVWKSKQDGRDTNYRVQNEISLSEWLRNGCRYENQITNPGFAD